MPIGSKKLSRQRNLSEVATLLLASALGGCGGETDTSHNETAKLFNDVPGTDGRDTLKGTPSNDLIQGFGGNDRIFAYGGADKVYPGVGANTVYAGPGDDTVFVSSLSDVIDGGTGNDTFVASGVLLVLPLKVDLDTQQFFQLGNSVPSPGTLTSIENVTVSSFQPVSIVGSSQNNVLITGDGDDIINTGRGENTVESNGGDDIVYINSASSQVSLGPGDDQLTMMSLTRGNLDGGSGVDRLLISGAENLFDEIEINLSSNQIYVDGTKLSLNLTNFEEVYHSGKAKAVLIGNISPNRLEGGAANDVISGQGGVDTLVGGEGSDTFVFRSIDHSSKLRHQDDILDFEVGAAGDILQFSGDWNLATSGNTIKFFDLNQNGIQTLDDISAVLVFTGSDLFGSNGSLLSKLNSNNGLQISGNSRYVDLELLCVSIADGDSSASVSVLHYDPNTADFVEDTVVVELTDITTTDVLDLVSYNFDII